jgi:hypothetical protein
MAREISGFSLISLYELMTRKPGTVALSAESAPDRDAIG